MRSVADKKKIPKSENIPFTWSLVENRNVEEILKSNWKMIGELRLFENFFLVYIDPFSLASFGTDWRWTRSYSQRTRTPAHCTPSGCTSATSTARCGWRDSLDRAPLWHFLWCGYQSSRLVRVSVIRTCKEIASACCWYRREERQPRWSWWHGKLTQILSPSQPFVSFVKIQNTRLSFVQLKSSTLKLKKDTVSETILSCVGSPFYVTIWNQTTFHTTWNFRKISFECDDFRLKCVWKLKSYEQKWIHVFVFIFNHMITLDSEKKYVAKDDHWIVYDINFSNLRHRTLDLHRLINCALEQSWKLQIGFNLFIDTLHDKCFLTE